MANKHRHEPETDPVETLSEGDFRRITGIGPGIEQRLKASGIHTFDQLAGLEVQEILDALHGLVGITAERITRQDWTGQARRLSEALRETHKSAGDETGDRQHYESFMVALLLEEDRSVRRTRVVHIKNGVKDNWAGWEPEKLTDWIAGEAELPRATRPDQAPETQAEPTAGEAALARPGLSGSLNLGEIRLTQPYADAPRRFFTAGEPFAIHLPLDLLLVETAPEAALLYRVTVSARELGTRRQLTLAERQGECRAGERPELTLPIEGMGMGVYRLEIAALAYPAAGTEADGLQALAEGGLLQVFAAEPARVN